jgi:hypothetical protein
VPARKFEMSLRRAIAVRRQGAGAADRIWSRGSRIAFLLAAAALCWAVPLLVIYLLAR